MKEIIYTVLDTGEDGRGKITEVFASKCEKERDTYLALMPKYNKMLAISTEKIVNLGEIADTLFSTLTPTQKLALRYTDWDKF
mgnify:FL=1